MLKYIVLVSSVISDETLYSVVELGGVVFNTLLKILEKYYRENWYIASILES